ncbi:MAG: cohesin domain-containing protein [Clostridium sp.]
MKKVLSVLLGLFMVLSYTPMKASALNENVSIDVTVSGEVKEGNEITINLKLNNVERFYAAQMDYKYNPEELELVSMTAGDINKNNNSGRYEVNGENGEIFKDKGVAKYAFTFMGSFEGNKGSGDFMTIKAKVLKDHNLKISMDNMAIKLVQRSLDDNMVAMNYKFNGYGKDVKPEEGNGYPEPGQGGNTGSNTGGNTGDSNSGSNGGTESGQGGSTEGTTGEEGSSDATEGDNKDGEDAGKTDEDKKDDGAAKGEGDKDSSKEESSSDKDSGSSTSKILIIGGIAIAVCGIGAFLYVSNKKKKKNNDDKNNLGM